MSTAALDPFALEAAVRSFLSSALTPLEAPVFAGHPGPDEYRSEGCAWIGDVVEGEAQDRGIGNGRWNLVGVATIPVVLSTIQTSDVLLDSLKASQTVVAAMWQALTDAVLDDPHLGGVAQSARLAGFKTEKTLYEPGWGIDATLAVEVTARRAPR